MSYLVVASKAAKREDLFAGADPFQHLIGACTACAAQAGHRRSRPSRGRVREPEHDRNSSITTIVATASSPDPPTRSGNVIARMPRSLAKADHTADLKLEGRLKR
jgi:hypothetical protein